MIKMFMINRQSTENANECLLGGYCIKEEYNITSNILSFFSIIFLLCVVIMLYKVNNFYAFFNVLIVEA